MSVYYDAGRALVNKTVAIFQPPQVHVIKALDRVSTVALFALYNYLEEGTRFGIEGNRLVVQKPGKRETLLGTIDMQAVERTNNGSSREDTVDFERAIASCLDWYISFAPLRKFLPLVLDGLVKYKKLYPEGTPGFKVLELALTKINVVTDKYETALRAKQAADTAQKSQLAAETAHKAQQAAKVAQRAQQTAEAAQRALAAALDSKPAAPANAKQKSEPDPNAQQPAEAQRAQLEADAAQKAQLAADACLNAQTAAEAAQIAQQVLHTPGPEEPLIIAPTGLTPTQKPIYDGWLLTEIQYVFNGVLLAQDKKKAKKDPAPEISAIIAYLKEKQIALEASLQSEKI